MKSLVRLFRFAVIGVGLVAVVVFAGPPAPVKLIPLGLASDADVLVTDPAAGKSLYIESNSVFDINYLTVVDIPTGERKSCNLGGFGPLRGPRPVLGANSGMDLNIDGTLLYVAHFAENRVGKYVTAKLVDDPEVFEDSKCVGAEAASVAGIPKPVGVRHSKFDTPRLDPNMQVLVLSYPTNSLFVIDATQEHKSQIKLAKRIELKGCDSPNDLARELPTSISLAYVICAQNDVVVKVDLVTGEVVGSATTGRTPVDITQAGPNFSKLYTADLASHTVTVIDASTMRVRRQITLCSPANPGIRPSVECHPLAITSTTDGRFVFVANASDESISVICALTDEELLKFRAFPETSNVRPGPVAVNHTNSRLYVSAEGAGVWEYDLNPLYDAYGGAGQACGG